MEKKPNKVKAWVKEHDVEIGVATCIGVSFVAGIAYGYFFGRMPKVKPIAVDENTVNKVKHILPVFNVGKLEDALRYDTGTIELWVKEIPLEDLGNLGAEITEQIMDLPDNAKVWTLMSISEG